MTIPFLFGGFLTDLAGRKNSLFIGIIVFVLGLLILAIYIDEQNLFMIILGQMFVTLSNGIRQIGLSTIIADETTPENRTDIFGKQSSISNVMGLFGPLFIGFMISGANIGVHTIKLQFSLFGETVYVSTFIFLIFTAGIGFFINVFMPATSAAFIAKNKMAKITDFTKQQMSMQKAFLTEEILLGFLSGAIVPFIDYYVLTTFQPNNFVWSLIFGISNSTIALGNLVVGRYAEQFGKGKMIVELTLFAPLFAMGIALSNTFFYVAIFYILRATFANAVQPAWQSWYFAHTLDSARGRTLSAIQVSRRLARAIGTGVGPAFFLVLGVMSFPTLSLFYPLAMAVPWLREQRI